MEIVDVVRSVKEGSHSIPPPHAIFVSDFTQETVSDLHVFKTTASTTNITMLKFAVA